MLIITLLLANDKVTAKPKQFQFNQSTIQAFYFVRNATILGDPIDKDDWIASFNDTVCVGSRKWNGKYTDIPAMGSDNSSYSRGYLIPGNTPLFFIYDKSENLTYLAKTIYTEPFGRGMAQIFHIDSLFVDFSDIFKSQIETNILNDLDSYKLIKDNKININNRDVKRLLYHHIIHGLCEHVLSI